MKSFSKRKFFIHPISVIVWLWLFVVLGVFPAMGYIFAIILHELGHYLTAKKCGYSLSQFSLSPYGVSLSYFDQNIETKDEIVIALAGPIFNLVTALFVVGIWWIFPKTYMFTDSFVFVSVCLALINLLPAYPLDGGRVFVCISRKFFSMKTAKKITIAVNLLLTIFFFALFVIFCFINFNPTYFLFAFFLIVGAVDLNFSTKYERINIFNKKCKDFACPKFVMVSGEVTIGEMIKKIQSSDTCIFCYVLENGKILNISEKMTINLSTKFPFNEKLKNIIK